MWEMIKAGGPVLYFIGVLSIVAVGYIIERFLTYSKAKTDMAAFMANLEKLIKANDMANATKCCEATEGLVPKIFVVGLRNIAEDIENLRRLLVEELYLTAVPHLRKNLNVLSTIAKSAPMLGLFGTVLGMIGAFSKIAGETKVDPSKLADDIGLALVTTAGGLVVAIPILYFYAYFRSRVRTFETETQKHIQRFSMLLRWRQQTSA